MPGQNKVNWLHTYPHVRKEQINWVQICRQEKFNWLHISSIKRMLQKTEKHIDCIAEEGWRQIGLDKNLKLVLWCVRVRWVLRGVSFKDVIYIAACEGVRNTLQMLRFQGCDLHIHYRGISSKDVRCIHT